jgi:hypothetical protein
VNDPLTLLVYILAGTAALLLLLGVLWWWRRERPDAAELERRRRAHLNRIGRMAEGRIVEVLDSATPSSYLLVYNYRVRGVEYQAAQDVAALRARLDLRRLAAGQSAQVKYDPQNPTNSIVLAEDWSGI